MTPFDDFKDTLSNAIRSCQRDRRGKRLATQSQKRHETVKAFLKHIGVSEKAAEIDSEGIEHHVSRETLAAMQRFLDEKPPVT